MSDNLEHLTEEDYEAIGAIVEGSVDLQLGQDVLDAVAAQEDRIQGRAEDPVLELLRQAHQVKAEDKQE